jgi:hypothetical protein
MLTAHPVPGKQKAVDICNAFIKGAPANAQGDVFFGVNHGNLAPYLRAKALGRDWWYLDNSYVDQYRHVYYRVTKNALQCKGTEPSTGERFQQLGVEIKPWRERTGNDILVCAQNDNFMATAVGYKGNWTKDTVRKLQAMNLPYRIRIRPWNPDKVKTGKILLGDLGNLHLLVTHSSASAITAMLEGVPAISESGAARVHTGPLTLESVLRPPRPETREQLAWALADNMWTLDEIRAGKAWEWLNRSK